MLLLLWTTTNLQVTHSLWFPPQLVVTRHTIPITGLSPALADAKIAVLSDIHFSSHYTHISQDFLESIVSTVNNLEPALVLVVGDVVNNDPGSAATIGRVLAQLKPAAGPHGTLVVLGNHDDRAIVKTLRELGMEVLVNEAKYPLGQGLALVGLGDVWLGDFQPQSVLDGLPPSEPRIVLSHHPDTANALRKWRVDLQVAGHTHATQIALPFVGAVLPLLHRIKSLLPQWLHEKIPYLGYTNVMEDWDLVYGLHEVQREGVEADGDPANRVLITAGVGTTPPFRLGIPPEVVLLTLVPRS